MGGADHGGAGGGGPGPDHVPTGLAQVGNGQAGLQVFYGVGRSRRQLHLNGHRPAAGLGHVDPYVDACPAGGQSQAEEEDQDCGGKGMNRPLPHAALS